MLTVNASAHLTTQIVATKEQRVFLLIIEWFGSGCGLMGAALLATNSVYSGYGFLFFLVSNICWLYYGLQKKAIGLVAMQVGFTVTSVLGLVRWFA